MPRICVTVKGETPQPYRFDLERKKITVGRASANDIQVGDGSVSTHHAVIRRVSGGYILEDLDSTNGVKLEESAMDIVDLDQTAKVKVGDVTLDFELADEELKELSDEPFKSKQRSKLPDLKEKRSEADDSEDLDGVASPEEKVAPRKRKAVSSVAEASSAGGGVGGILYVLLMLALAIGAFFIGLSIRHSKETGRSLMADLTSGGEKVEDSGNAKDSK